MWACILVLHQGIWEVCFVKGERLYGEIKLSIRCFVAEIEHLYLYLWYLVVVAIREINCQAFLDQTSEHHPTVTTIRAVSSAFSHFLEGVLGMFASYR